SGTVLTIVLSLLQCRQSACQDHVVLRQGDVMLGALFAVNNIENNGCGEFSASLLRGVTAVTWFLDQLNAMDYVPGVTLGLHAYRTCHSSEVAARGAIELMETYKILGTDVDWNATTPLLGLLGPSTTNEAIVVSRMIGSMPEDKRLLQISGSATGEALSDRTLYPSFFRVIPPDSTQVDVLAELLVQLKWNYVAIVYNDDAYGRHAATQLRGQAQDRGICVPVFAALPLDYKSIHFRDEVRTIILQIDVGKGSPVKGVVFIGRAIIAKTFVRQLGVVVSYVRFIFSEALGLKSGSLAGTTLGKGALAASPPFLPLPESRDHWMRIWENRTVFQSEASKNPWLARFYEEVTACTLADEGCWETNRGSESLVGGSSQWLFEYYIVRAVAVFAAFLKDLHRRTCAVPGVCLSLKNTLKDRGILQDHFQSHTFNLESEFSRISSAFIGQASLSFNVRSGDIVNGSDRHSLYDIYNFRQCQESEFCFQKVGTYTTDKELDLDTSEIRGYSDDGVALTWAEFPTSQCLDGHDCLECLPKSIPGQIVFIPGDFYFLAVAPVHDRSREGALHCGEIRTLSGSDLVQNVIFAVDQVNSKSRSFAGIFGDKKLGVIILDSCYRELVIKERLIELYNGKLLLPDGTNSSQILPLIAGVVGGYYSTTSWCRRGLLQHNQLVSSGTTTAQPAGVVGGYYSTTSWCRRGLLQHNQLVSSGTTTAQPAGVVGGYYSTTSWCRRGLLQHNQLVSSGATTAQPAGVVGGYYSTTSWCRRGLLQHNQLVSSGATTAQPAGVVGGYYSTTSWCRRGLLQHNQLVSSGATTAQPAGVVGDYYSTTSWCRRGLLQHNQLVSSGATTAQPALLYTRFVLSKLGTRFVHVGPSNTSPLFSDKTVYPYFLRMITKQEEFNRALFSLLRELQFHYVQVIYDPSDVYTSTVRDGMNAIAPQYNICIAQSLPTKYEDTDMNLILNRMRRKGAASVVIVILVPQHIEKLMDRILPEMTSTDKFFFIGGSAWSRIEAVFRARSSKRLLGTLSFSQELPQDVRFNDYFEKVDPLTSRNPWLKYFWEKRNRCYFDGSFLRKDKTGPCTQHLTQDYRQDPWTPFFIGVRPNFLCDEVTSERLVEALKTVKLDLYNTGQPVKVFDDNGDGDIGYTVFQISRGDAADSLEYTEVGRYEHGKLTLDNKNDLLVVRTGHSDGHTCSMKGSVGDSDIKTVIIPGVVTIVILLVIVIVFAVHLCHPEVVRSPSRPGTWGRQGGLSMPVAHSMPEMVSPNAELAFRGAHNMVANWTLARRDSENPSGSAYDFLDLRSNTASPADRPPSRHRLGSNGHPGNASIGENRITSPDAVRVLSSQSGRVSSCYPSTACSSRVSSPETSVKSLFRDGTVVKEPSEMAGVSNRTHSFDTFVIADADLPSGASGDGDVRSDSSVRSETGTCSSGENPTVCRINFANGQSDSLPAEHRGPGSDSYLTPMYVPDTDGMCTC
ncbi:hypothetical protein BaRGS_00034911, partial [Batillaria attramentaria]